ncbi:Dynamin-A, partial [Orchesella cincta]
MEGVERIDGLIPIFNTIHDILERTKVGPGSVEIPLPQIVVIGSQSSGKSSVLENLVGQPFLPRGSGIVTRCPIVLRMILTPGNDTWCEFFHKPNEKFDDFRKVEQEIISRTDEIAGTDFGITSESIKITIYSPTVLNLTVVDLPGLVKIPVGQQPDDIEEQVKNLILGYISADDAVILAHKNCQDGGPNQERTIVVLTKLDLTDDYSKMTDVLNGKLGYVGVINRSQDDLKGDKPIEEVLKHEKAFLAEKFSSISAKHGISCLAKKLNRILLQRILACCSGLSLNIRNLSTASESELRELGVDEEMTEEEKKKELFKIVDEFAKEYKAQIDGMSRSEVQSMNLTCGARIDIIINNNLPNELDCF